MSWDIVLFSYKEKISSPEDIDEQLFEPTDFCSILQSHFRNIKKDGNHRSIQEKDFMIEYFSDEEKAGNTILNLYGENGLFEIIVLARKHNWQIFDTGLGQMIDLDDPAKNGYRTFQNYLSSIINR
jgi:hypothetical protein